MKYQLICLDLDGTLLDDQKAIQPQVKTSIQKAAKMGIQIALITGKMPAGADAIERELDVTCIKACNAGTYIVLGEQCIYAEYLLPSTMKSIYLEIAKKHNVPLWIFQDRKWFVTDIDHFIEREIEVIQYQPEIADAEELAEQWERKGTGPSKLLIAAEPEMIRLIYQEMKARSWEDIDFACSDYCFLEIFPRGSTKGKALSVICEKLQIDLKHTIAFGDQELDIPMIEAAGIGVAMGNSIEELKERADFVTKSNNDAGVAYALEHIIF